MRGEWVGAGSYSRGEIDNGGGGGGSRGVRARAHAKAGAERGASMRAGCCGTVAALRAVGGQGVADGRMCACLKDVAKAGTG